MKRKFSRGGWETNPPCDHSVGYSPGYTQKYTREYWIAILFIPGLNFAEDRVRRVASTEQIKWLGRALQICYEHFFFLIEDYVNLYIRI